MAKDPAFLFYPNDWMGGTMILTRHNKGCYIDLLVAQFNSGPLSLETIKTVLGTDQASWTVLSKKFKQDSQGNFFNERLEAEKEKRQKFVLHQRENGLKGGRPKNPKETHGLANHKPKQKPLENENENRDLNISIEKGVQGEKLSDQVIQNTIEFVKITAQRDLSSTEILEYWKAFLIHSECEQYISENDKVQHFRNWIKKQQNGNSKNTSAGNGQSGSKQTRFDTVSNLK